MKHKANTRERYVWDACLHTFKAGALRQSPGAILSLEKTVESLTFWASDSLAEENCGKTVST